MASAPGGRGIAADHRHHVRSFGRVLTLVGEILERARSWLIAMARPCFGLLRSWWRRRRRAGLPIPLAVSRMVTKACGDGRETRSTTRWLHMTRGGIGRDERFHSYRILIVDSGRNILAPTRALVRACARSIGIDGDAETGRAHAGDRIPRRAKGVAVGPRMAVWWDVQTPDVARMKLLPGSFVML